MNVQEVLAFIKRSERGGATGRSLTGMNTEEALTFTRRSEHGGGPSVHKRRRSLTGKNIEDTLAFI